MPLLLTIASNAQCPHGGQAVFKTENIEAKVYGQLILLITDEYDIVGCPFQFDYPVEPGFKPWPCVKLRWIQGTGTVQALGRRFAREGDRVPMVFMPTQGLCYNRLEIPQGPALLSAPSIADAL
jgi:hypothetical protein